MVERAVKGYLPRLMEEAAQRWGKGEAEGFRSAIERTARAILGVEAYRLEPGDEPALRLRHQPGEG